VNTNILFVVINNRVIIAPHRLPILTPTYIFKRSTNFPIFGARDNETKADGIYTKVAMVGSLDNVSSRYGIKKGREIDALIALKRITKSSSKLELIRINGIEDIPFLLRFDSFMDLSIVGFSILSSSLTLTKKM
jgi:hypothetical protein